MEKNIKRLALALLALGLSAPAFADTYSPCITIPTQQGGFTIGADALYMRASAPNTSYYQTIDPSPLLLPVPGTQFSSQIHTLDPNYQWGFDVFAAYRIPCTGNDISAMWTHLSDNNNDRDRVAGTPLSITPADITLTFTPSGEGSVDFNNYDAVDVDAGQRVNFGNHFQFHIFTGVRWAQIEENISTTNYLATTLSTLPGLSFVQSNRIQDDSKFNGFGPQFGLDGRYCVGYGFGLDAKVVASLLIGRTDASSDNTITFPTIPGALVGTTIQINNNLDSSTHVVPALDASLGVDYTYNFNNCDRSSLVIQAGWKVIQYWDVARDMYANGDHGVSTFVAPTFGGTATGLFPNNPSNIAFQGPYAGIKVNL